MDELEVIKHMLDEASIYDLEVEIILAAIKIAKADPNMSLEEICNAALIEWEI